MNAGGDIIITGDIEITEKITIPAVNVTIRSDGEMRTIRRTYTNRGIMFTVESGGDVTLENITFDGVGTILASGPVFENCGILTIGEGAVVQNNNANSTTESKCGAILNYEELNITGGTVKGNRNSAMAIGGGIYNEGTVNISSGSISGNTSNAGGGGVYNVGILNVIGGEISGNTTNKEGGGVYNAGILNVSGGEINGNHATMEGGGICNYAVVNVTGGEISENTTLATGGGIYDNTPLSTITDGKLRDNINSTNEITLSPGISVYTVAFSVVNGNGTLVPSSGTASDSRVVLNEGSGITLTATPDLNYRIVTWTHNNTVIPGAGSSFELTNIKAPHSVTVEFVTKIPSIDTPPSASNIYKGEALSASALSGGLANVPGTFTWTSGGTTPAESGSFSVTFKPNDMVNYISTTTSAHVTMIDKDALEALIIQAVDVKNASVVGVGNGQHTQADYDDFSSAISIAEGVANTAAALSTPEAVDEAVSDLQAAINTFNNALIVVDTSDLTALITAAIQKKASATYGDRNGDYDPAQEAALGNVIAAAQAAANKTDRTPTEVADAIDTLELAIDVFNNAKVGVDYQPLKDLIDTAKTAKEETMPGNGYWFVPSKYLAVLQAAIDAAQLVADDDYLTEAAVNSAYSDLEAALAAFYAVRVKEGVIDDPPVTPPAPDKNPFKDVAIEHWFFYAAMYVYKTGLMNGIKPDMFAPDTSMTRAMLVTVLYRYEGEPSITAESLFRDVLSGQWYSDAVIWASEKGIVEGYGDELFGPEDDVTRQQVATILMRYAKWKNLDVTATKELSEYSDAGEIADWALAAMKWANAEGIMTGRTPTTLVPNGSTTRAEIAALLMRFVEDFVEA